MSLSESNEFNMTHLPSEPNDIIDALSLASGQMPKLQDEMGVRPSLNAQITNFAQSLMKLINIELGIAPACSIRSDFMNLSTIVRVGSEREGIIARLFPVKDNIISAEIVPERDGSGRFFEVKVWANSPQGEQALRRIKGRKGVTELLNRQAALDRYASVEVTGF